MGKVTRKAKEPVRLRTKQIANGCQSLYLDIYTGGRRSYEFLKMYLIPERTPADKVRNAETLRTANAIKAQRIVELQNNTYGFTNSGARGNITLTDYLMKQAETYNGKGKTSMYKNILVLVRLINEYKSGVTFRQIDRGYLLGLIEYLNKAKNYKGLPLAKITVQNLFSILATMLKKAVADDIIQINPATKIKHEERPQAKQTNREYLTLDEVKRVADTICTTKQERVKRAFMFSCFCGLRLCDIRRLRWCDIQTIKDNKKQIEITQQKTGEPLYLPLSDNALYWLPEKGTAPDIAPVFPLPVSSVLEIHIDNIAKAAGIAKRVTFHVARHTNATLLLAYGVDIYTVSKLLGHTNVKTTQIYAKVIDESKRRAVDKIPNIL